MGVQGLWELISPVGERVPNAHVRNKRMAVDASIWLTQFVRAMRETEGARIPNAHLIGIFRRCCKLLFLKVRPVLVFDGATPAIKRRTRDLRRAQQDRDVAKLRRLAERLLANQMQSAALSAVTGTSRKRKGGPLSTRGNRRRATGDTAPALSYDPDLDDVDIDLTGNAAKASDALLDEFDVEEEPEIAIELPDDVHEIDDEAITNLPGNVQAEIFKRIRQAQRAQHRAQVMKRKGDPESFSKAQIEGFLKNTTLNRRIRGVRNAINDKSGANQRIASDSKRMYLLEEGAHVDDDLDLDSSDEEVKQNVQSTMSKGDQQLDLLARIRIKRETVQAMGKGQHQKSIDQSEGSNPNDTGLGWASKVLHSGGSHRLEAEYEGDKIGDLSSEDDMPTLHVSATGVLSAKKSIPKSDSEDEWEECQILTKPSAKAQGPDSDSDDDIEWEDPVESKIQQPSDASAKVNNEDVINVDSDDVEPVCEGKDIVGANEGGMSDADDEDVQVQEAIMQSMQKSVPPERVLVDKRTPQDNSTPTQNIADRPLSRLEDNAPTVVKASEKNDKKRDSRASMITSEAIGQAIEEFFGDMSDSESEQAIEPSTVSDFQKTQLESSFAQKKPSKTNTADEISVQKAMSKTIDPKVRSVALLDADEKSAPFPKDTDPPTKGTSLDVDFGRDHSLSGSANEDKNSRHNTISLEDDHDRAKSANDNEEAHEGNVFDDDPDVKTIVSRFDDEVTTDQINEANVAAAENILKNTENATNPVDDIDEVRPVFNEAEIERLRNDLESERAQLVRKRNDQQRVVESISDEMIEETCHLLQLFGIPFVQAPFEAEAQCAFLNKKGLVDGVITEDSDTFLFGANTVYRHLFADGKFAEAYEATAIKSELGIDQDKLIQLAYLLGSDYTRGVRGVGIVNSMEVLEAFPGENGLTEFRDWAKGAAILDREPEEDIMNSNTQAAIRRKFCWKHRNMKRNWIFHGDFPNPRVAEAYWKPDVNTSETEFQWGRVDFAGLQRFCWQKLGWDGTRFENSVGPLRKELTARKQTGSEQRRIEEFFKPHRFAKIKSERLQKAVRGIAGDKSEHIMADAKKKSSKTKAVKRKG